MKLTSYVDPRLVLENVTAKDKKELLSVLVKHIESVFPELRDKNLLHLLVEREELGTTGIGQGIAIPHAKLADLEKIILLFARSVDGVDFASLDNKPVYLIFLVLAPEQNVGEHLRILAHISRLFQDDSFRRSLMEAKGKQELVEILKGV